MPTHVASPVTTTSARIPRPLPIKIRPLAGWRNALLLLLGAAIAALPGAATAGGASEQHLDGKALAEGTLEGLSVDADGIVRPGPQFESVPLEAPTAWCAAPAGGSAMWIGTGNKGEVVRAAYDGALTRIAIDDALMVTAMAARSRGKDEVYAGVFPGGRVVLAGADGSAKTVAALPAEHIWGIHIVPGEDAIVVATGMPGAVFRVDAFGAAEKLADVGDDHARCLVRDGDGWLVGTAPKGRVLRVADGNVKVVHDLDAKEVVGLVRLADDSLLIAANQDEAGGNAKALQALLRSVATPSATKPGKKPAERGSLQSGVVLHLETNGALRTLWSEKKVAALSLTPDGAGAALGTYPGGRILQVTPGQAHAVLADLDEAEVSVVASDGGETPALVAAITSNPAVLHIRKVSSAPAGTWTSAPLDAGAVARWGRMELWSAGVASVELRTGETESADDTWAAWQAAPGAGSGAWIASGTARYVQVRVQLKGNEAFLRSLRIVRQTPNQSPELSELTWSSPGAPNDGGPPSTATTNREFTWKVSDADDDALRTTVRVQREGTERWTDLVDDESLSKGKHVWDTTGWPDGRYVVEVEVHDGDDNPQVRMRRSRARATGVLVDNTAPVIAATLTRKSGGSLSLEGTATDSGGGRIQRIRASLDGGPWQVLSAGDGLLDSASESFLHVFGGVDAKAHDVVVQVTDAAGNQGTAARSVGPSS